MKILHASALVGYLAVTTLPYYPFGFALPIAAIDYNGYVNTGTQNQIDGAFIMKHVLGSHVETCQTITTQNHSGNALMKRVSGDIIEARQLEVVEVVIILEIASTVALSVLWIAQDDPVRADVEVLVDH